MTPIKLTVGELEDLVIEGEITTETAVCLKVIKEGRWESEGKFESKTVIFTDGDRHYRGSVMREGSYYSDYAWGSEWDDGDADIEEVAEVPVTTTEWQPVIERGVYAQCFVDETPPFYLADEAPLPFSADYIDVISPAVRTASGWYPIGKTKEVA